MIIIYAFFGVLFIAFLTCVVIIFSNLFRLLIYAVIGFICRRPWFFPETIKEALEEDTKAREKYITDIEIQNERLDKLTHG